MCDKTRRGSGLAWWAVLVLGWAAAAAPAEDAAPAALAPEVQRAWDYHHPRYLKKFIHFEGRFVPVDYDARARSSAKMTVEDATRQVQRDQRTRPGGGKSRTMNWPRAEADALVNVLPRLEVGQYGYLHSVRCVKVVGDDQLIATDAWLIDANALRQQMSTAHGEIYEAAGYNNWYEARGEVERGFAVRRELMTRQEGAAFQRQFRFVGFPARGALEMERWSGGNPGGLRVAIVAEEPAERDPLTLIRQPNSRLVCIPAEWLERGVTQDQFRQLLRTIGMDEAAFVTLVLDLRRLHPRDAEDRVRQQLADGLRRVAPPPPPATTPPPHQPPPPHE